jgi:hypothetical protein
MFLCVYLSCTAAAARILTGRTRAAAAVAVLAVLAVLAFCGWALLAAAAVALAAALAAPHRDIPQLKLGQAAAARRAVQRPRARPAACYRLVITDTLLQAPDHWSCKYS